MLVKKISYTDFDGNEREETHYFNLTRTEVVEMQWSTPGGLKALLDRIVEEQDIKEILDIIREILSKAYGVKSADGRRFDKDPALWVNFTQSLAFDELFMELMTNAGYAAEFMNSIVPDLRDHLPKENS